jgi:hypothetical protein
MQNERPLAQVIEHQCGQGEAEPAQPDRTRPEVAAVRVQGLGPGHGQDHAAEH